MKTHSFVTVLVFILANIASTTSQSQNSDTLWVQFTPVQCDSLVQANATNPDFVVMDVRTPGEYIPDHIENAINRDYYATNFHDLINLLPHNKIYMIYCSGGSRSLSTYNLMITMGFTQLVNMLGGISSWKNENLPTTPDFAPLQMAVSDTVIPNDTVYIGMTDTLHLTVTNRANDTLRFTGITSLAGTEFSTDFDLATKLEGPFDYTFSVFYTPIDEQADYLSLLIESNGGNVRFQIWRTGELPSAAISELSYDQWKIYPNPFTTSATIENKTPATGKVEFIIYNQFGQVVDEIVQQNADKGKNTMIWNAEGLPAGIYFCRLNTGRQVTITKLVKW